MRAIQAIPYLQISPFSRRIKRFGASFFRARIVLVSDDGVIECLAKDALCMALEA